MGELILENLSGKKLTVLAFFLMISQLICFLIGGLIGESRKYFFLFFSSLFLIVSYPALHISHSTISSVD